MTAEEQKLHDYLDGMDVRPGDAAMQEMVINSFYNQREMDNDDGWGQNDRLCQPAF